MQTTRAGRVHSAAKESFLCLCAVSFLAALLLTSASGAPDPTTNKNAILVDLDCDGYHVIASGIFQSHSPTFLVVSSELPGVEPGSAAPTAAWPAFSDQAAFPPPPSRSFGHGLQRRKIP